MAGTTQLEEDPEGVLVLAFLAVNNGVDLVGLAALNFDGEALTNEEVCQSQSGRLVDSR